MMVARVWRKHALRPRRLESYMASNDPEFETKTAEIIGLYLHPPQRAVTRARKQCHGHPHRAWPPRPAFKVATLSCR
jgi:hypothetical protein